MSFDETIVFRNTHWVTVDGETLTIGLTEDCVAEFDEIESIELPEEGDNVGPEEPCGALVTGSGRLRLYAPIDGEVTAVNHKLEEDQSLIEEDPIGEGWIFKIEATNPDEVSQLLSGDMPEIYDDAEDDEDEDLDEDFLDNIDGEDYD